MSDIRDLLVARDLQYAKTTIIDRALPYIDGCKPVQRRILWAMYELGLTTGGTKKSARIVGDCMGKYHPHGDQSIYEALCKMEGEYDGFNAPLVLGQGNFGRAWSNPKFDGGIHASKMRYTEAKLTPLAAELFDGIKEGAVTMVDNYDGTEKEPYILPTKFPNILVNANKGVAVGVASYVPNYTLKNACLAIAALIHGKKTAEEIVDILGAPDFPVGCTIHYDRELLMKLLTTGSATFAMTGGFHRQGDDLVIDSVPVGVSFERVTEQLKELAASPDGRNEIIDILSNVGLGSAGILIKCKKNINLKALMLKILQKTDVRSTVSFKTRIIVDEVPVELNVLELMNKWVEFRSDCVKKVYTNRASKLAADEHKLSTWEIIHDDIKEVVKTMGEMSEAEARDVFAAKFNLDEEQLDYLFNLRIKTICTDKAEQEMKNLISLRDKLKNTEFIRDDEAARNLMIAQELEEIAAKYGTEPACKSDGMVPEEEKIKQERIIPDTMTTVFITKRGFVKCIHSMLTEEEASRYMSEDDELVVPPIYVRQNDTLLVYTYNGFCYKVAVDDIESSKTDFKQYVWDIIDRKDTAPILYACAAGDYNKAFTIVYGHGRGRKVFTCDVSGRQKCYKNQFLPGNNTYGSKDRIFVVPYKRFYMITKNNKAAYGNVTNILQLTSRAAFKVARTPNNDPVEWFLNAEKVDETGIDVERYCKDYCVKAIEPALTAAIEQFKPKGC